MIMIVQSVTITYNAPILLRGYYNGKWAKPEIWIYYRA
jgi:hypothetical protein